MKTLLRAAVVAGITYLMNNKQARQKVMGTIQSFTSKSKQQQPM